MVTKMVVKMTIYSHKLSSIYRISDHWYIYYTTICASATFFNHQCRHITSLYYGTTDQHLMIVMIYLSTTMDTKFHTITNLRLSSNKFYQ